MTNWIDTLVDTVDPAVAAKIFLSTEVEFLAAAENDVNGRTVKLRLVRTPDQQGSANPFALATRRRRGHCGSTYEVIMTALGTEEVSTYSAVLMNWSDGPQGATVTLKIADSDDPHPFMFCRRPTAAGPGSRWMAVFVETRDEQPVDQVKTKMADAVDAMSGVTDALRGAEPPRDFDTATATFVTRETHRQSVAQQAAIVVRAPAFHDWLRETVEPRDWNEGSADAWLKAALGIASKTELNTSEEARRGWERIRNAYAEFSGRGQYPG